MKSFEVVPVGESSRGMIMRIHTKTQRGIRLRHVVTHYIFLTKVYKKASLGEM